MDAYRQIGEARCSEDIKRAEEDFKDLFGELPVEVDLLLQVSDIRIRASSWGLKSIVVSGEDLVFVFSDQGYAADLFARAPGTVRIPDPKTVYVRPGKNYFEPRTVLSLLRKIFRTNG